MIDVDSQHLAQQHLAVLSIAERIAGATAVAEPDVEKSVRTEGQLSTFVIGEWLVDGEQNSLAIGIGLVGIAGRRLKFSNHGLHLSGDNAVVVDEKAPILAIGGMKCKAE